LKILLYCRLFETLIELLNIIIVEIVTQTMGI